MSIFSLTSQVIVDENFDNGLPSGWSVDGGWKLGTTASLKSDYFNFGNNTTKFIGTNDDALGASGHGDGKISTNLIDFTNYPNVLLAFDLYYFNANYGGDGQETMKVLYSEDGNNWTEITSIETFYIWRTFYFDISSFVGGKTAKIAIQYKDGNNWNYGAGVDNFKISAQPDYFAVAFPPSTDFKQIENRGDDKSFNVAMEYYGKETLSNYKLIYSIDDTEEKEIVGTTDLISNSSLTFEVPGFELGKHILHSKVVLNDDMIVDIEDKECSVFPPVPNFQRTDVDGNAHDIIADLKGGKKVMIDFFASWCNPCKESTPLISSVWESHNYGSEDFQVYGITSDRDDDDDKIKGLNWGGKYPTFGYGFENRVFYSLFNDKFGENSIPFFVMICPNKEDPAFSSVTWTQSGYNASTLKNKIETAITGCGIELEKNVEFVKDSILVNTTSEKETVLHIKMKNTGDTIRKIYWRLVKEVFNHSWSTQICDNNDVCYPYNVDNAPKPSIVDAGKTEELKLTILYGDIEDKGKIIVEIYDNKDFTNLVDILPIEINVDFPVATSNLGLDNIKIAPNPASNLFRISNTKDVSKIEIYSLVGKKIKTITNINTNGYDISDLRNGIYMISIIGKDNKVIKALKLNVTKSRP